MLYTKTEIAQLILNKISGSSTNEEDAILQQWRERSLDNEAFYQALLKPGALHSGVHDFDAAKQQATWAKPPKISTSTHAVYFMRKWGWAAASAILVLGIGAYLLKTNENNRHTTAIAQAATDSAPGTDGAILTLADGRQVILDSLQNGVIASQNGSKVVLNNGLLAYDLTGESTDAAVYNTITTPNGRQFTATLPDGTRVWLNAGSSIRYPTVFNTQDRRVAVTGEVYMEVAANKSKPFLVSTHDMEVQVLGTSFNINAYSDEPNIKTTLLDGSIKVLKKAKPLSSLILKPGQQVVLDENLTINKTVNIEQVVAWKNGVFNLNGATLEEFMRQIARWYNLKVVYKGAIPHELFRGEMGRDLQLSQIMKVLTLYNIKYELSGNTITIER